MKNKIALVSGAGAGIGHAICKALADDGATIIAVARNENNLQQLQQQLNSDSHQFWPIDLSSPDGKEKLFFQLSVFGFPHIVVCNINIPSEKKRLINIKEENFSKGFTANIDHIITILEKTLQFQRSENFGRWIGVSSFAAGIGLPGQVVYNAQKAAMEALILNIATEEGKHGITANIVSPGFIQTPATETRIPKEMFDKLASYNVLRRAGKPEDVAAAIRFFASQDAAFITGVNLPVCGGAQLAWNF
ncbi:MAG: SDR family oxidoreductase [Bacteroidetes bacterium]|nr:SDR family oxidoreductase [Bacteroidota bacterium]